MSDNFQNKDNKPLNVYLPLTFAFVMILGMQLGFKMYEGLKGKPSISFGSSSSELQEVFSYIDGRYVDTMNNQKLMEKVIEETLNGLDPHSTYIPARDLQGVNENLQGNFDGIGVEFSIVKDTIVVITPIAGGPSEKLGIRAGDKIVQIEDTLVAGIEITNQDVLAKLRGRKGTVVNIDIHREGYDELLDFDIKRDKIPIYSVDLGYMMDDKTGYIKINRFSATTYEEFFAELKKLKGMGMEKLMLDLRQNPGGYLNAAVSIADEFIDGRKLLVYTQGRQYRRKEYKSSRRGLFEEGELAILIDEGSASASEIVAGAIQDWDRGAIVGRRSFGKGLVQEQYELSQGSALRLTVARYYTPTGRCIQKSYEEGEDAYHKELADRFEQGELQSPDSIQTLDTLAFETLVAHRTVYGGGGVSPDFFIPIDTSRNETFLVAARSHIAEFVYDHFSHHQDFYHSFEDLAQFRSKFTVSPDLFGQFTAHLKKEIKDEDFQADLLQRERHHFEVYIKAFIARQLWQDAGFYPVFHEIDATLQEAYTRFQKGELSIHWG